MDADYGLVGLHAVTHGNKLTFNVFLIRVIFFLCFRRNSNESSSFDLVCGLAAARVTDLHFLVIWVRWKSWVFGTTTHFASTPPVTHQGEEIHTAVCLPNKLAPCPFPLTRNIETCRLISTSFGIFLDVLKIRNLLILWDRCVTQHVHPCWLLTLRLNCIFTWLFSKEILTVYKLYAW